ncbi:MAG: hypothetical protein NTX09_05885 [Verrucomicrobia bacterium]|nr:hypothetical protein [Verrucomicrobiota bacterium]
MKTFMLGSVGRRVVVVGWLVAASAAFAQGPRGPQAPQGPGQAPLAPVVVPVPVANPAPVAAQPDPNAGRRAPQINPLGQPLAGLTAAELMWRRRPAGSGRSSTTFRVSRVMMLAARAERVGGRSRDLEGP